MLNSLGRLHGEMEAEDWCPDIRFVHVDGPAVGINISEVTQKIIWCGFTEKVQELLAFVKR